MQKNLDYYLKLPWTFRFEWDPRDNIYVARIAELKYCASHGDTIEEAAHNIREALEQHLDVMLEDNLEIPEPPKIEDYKGKSAFCYFLLAISLADSIMFNIAPSTSPLSSNIGAPPTIKSLVFPSGNFIVRG